MTVSGASGPHQHAPALPPCNEGNKSEKVTIPKETQEALLHNSSEQEDPNTNKGSIEFVLGMDLPVLPSPQTDIDDPFPQIDNDLSVPHPEMPTQDGNFVHELNGYLSDVNAIPSSHPFCERVIRFQIGWYISHKTERQQKLH